MKTFKEYIVEGKTEGAIMEEIIVAAWNGTSIPTSKSIPLDAGNKIVQYLRSNGVKKGEHASKLATGKDVTSEWSKFWLPESVPPSTKTPKTDIVIGKHKISLKMGDAAQLMSGGSNEYKATFYAACSKMQSTEDELLKTIWDKIDSLATSSIASGQLGPLIKSGKDEVINKANKVNNEVKNLMKQVFSTNKEFRSLFIQEALTGDTKFGSSSTSTAQYVLSTDIPGNKPKLHKTNDKAYIDNLVSKTAVTVRFKTTSVAKKSKGVKEKTGEYRYWSVVSLITSKLEEEFSNYDGALLTEGILSNIYKKVKVFVSALFEKVYAFLKGGVKQIIEFFDFEPHISLNNEIDFSGA